MLAPTFWRQRRWAKAPTFDAKKMPIFLKSIDVLGAVSITPKMNLNGCPVVQAPDLGRLRLPGSWKTCDAPFCGLPKQNFWITLINFDIAAAADA